MFNLDRDDPPWLARLLLLGCAVCVGGVVLSVCREAASQRAKMERMVESRQSEALGLARSARSALDAAALSAAAGAPTGSFALATAPVPVCDSKALQNARAVPDTSDARATAGAMAGAAAADEAGAQESSRRAPVGHPPHAARPDARARP